MNKWHKLRLKPSLIYPLYEYVVAVRLINGDRRKFFSIKCEFFIFKILNFKLKSVNFTD